MLHVAPAGMGVTYTLVENKYFQPRDQHSYRPKMTLPV